MSFSGFFYKENRGDMYFQYFLIYQKNLNILKSFGNDEEKNVQKKEHGILQPIKRPKKRVLHCGIRCHC